MTDFIQYLIKSGIEITGIPFYEEWLEIDTVKDLKLEATQKRIQAISEHLNQKF